MVAEPLEPGGFGADLLDHVPELRQLADLDVRIVCNVDSSDLGPPEWTHLAQTIASEREAYDGFVIVHGTDTMAFTAGALAFALQGLDRPVVLTGAQRPLAVTRSDARRNLVDAVEVATMDLPEVAICFDGLLLRGCRSVKADTRHYRAFASPGVEPLARLGTGVQVAQHIRRPVDPFVCIPAFDPAVDVIHLAPGLRPEILSRRLSDPALRGVVLAAFGAGTMPSNGLDTVLAEAIEGGIEVLAVTQWGGWVDLDLYANSRQLKLAGAVPGGSMRIEAAVPKLMHALANHADRVARRAWLLRNLAGERC